MADILNFRSPRAKPTAPRRRSRAKSAEIVIFPGVRYERWASAEAEAGKPAKPAKGDTLRLIDA